MKKSMVKHITDTIGSISPGLLALLYRIKIEPGHRRNTRRVKSKKQTDTYYIFRFDATLSDGWTVWERAVMFACIYAQDHGMIPVVDMKNCKSIYQEAEDFGKVNTWEQYYEQPAGISLEEALASGSYVLGDPSKEWAQYTRMRTPKRFTDTFLREKFNQFIRLNAETVRILEANYRSVIPTGCSPSDVRLFGLCVRGTDYITFHHPKQPSIEQLTDLVREKCGAYNCQYIYVATEDADLFARIQAALSDRELLSYQAGSIRSADGLIGDYIRTTVSARDAAVNYLTVLYILNKCTCLAGGFCGATMVAKWRRKPPYEYINIINTNELY